MKNSSDPFGSLRFEDQRRVIAPIWRLVISILIAQIVGASLGMVREITGPSIFLNLWYGGVYATPVGFFIGLTWHALASENPFGRNSRLIVLLGLMSVALPFFAWLTADFVLGTP